MQFCLERDLLVRVSVWAAELAAMRSNLSLGTDTHLQDAALRRVLRAGQL